jgi:2'-phosphotransferase
MASLSGKSRTRKGAKKKSRKAAKHDIALSKKLSKLLRHHPRQLTMTDAGFVKVAQILKFDDFQQYTVNDIVSVVEANDKQRFRIDGTGCHMMIRANQGHTIKTINQDKLLSRVTSCSQIPICVHGTYFKSWIVIKTDGLNKMQRNHVHMAVGTPEEKDVISGMRSSCELVIYIDVEKAMKGGLIFYTSSNNVILCEGPINPKYFSKVIQRSDGLNLLDADAEGREEQAGETKDSEVARGGEEGKVCGGSKR